MAKKPSRDKTDCDVHFEIIPARKTMRDTGGAIIIHHPNNRLLSQRAVLISGPAKASATLDAVSGDWEILLSWTMGASDQFPARVQFVSHDQDRNVSDSYAIDEEWIIFPPTSVRDWVRPPRKPKSPKKPKAKSAPKKNSQSDK
jgi:hypothetical protein